MKIRMRMKMKMKIDSRMQDALGAAKNNGRYSASHLTTQVVLRRPAISL